MKGMEGGGIARRRGERGVVELCIDFCLTHKYALVIRW
jgi:hypothetical protein